MNPYNEKYILASASPRRSELLSQVGLEFRVEVADCDEETRESDPARMVQELALRKAMAVAEKHPEEIVIGADTVVVYEDEIMGKPADEKEALDMLMYLSGRTHMVMTGVAIVCKNRGIERVFAELTQVSMYENDRDLLKRYIASGEPMDKAGSYGIQGRGAILVRSISGDYNNVVGLPVSALFRELSEIQGSLES